MINSLTFFEVFIGIAAAISTGILGWFVAVKKAKSDETQVVVEAWKSLLEPLQLELVIAREEIQELKQAIKNAEERHILEREELLLKIRELKRQINKNNGQ